MVRSTAVGDGIHVVVVHAGAQLDPEAEAQAYADGADDVIAARAPPRYLRFRLNVALRRLECYTRRQAERLDLQRIAKDLSLSHRKHELLALTDPLTHLPNRRAGLVALERVWQGSLRTGTPCAVLIIDIDHFKTINDDYGHAVGDQVLRQIASILQAEIRSEETIARMGGEEFLLIGANVAIRDVVIAGNRLRRQIEQTEIQTDRGALHITVSVGTAVREAHMSDPDGLVIAADRALYAAKSAGRNRIAVAAEGHLTVTDKADS